MKKIDVILVLFFSIIVTSCGSTTKVESYRKVGSKHITKNHSPKTNTSTSNKNSIPNYRSDNYKFSAKEVESLLKVAKSFLGSPYKYGGTTNTGFDCSGLVMVSFDKLGLKLPRNSSQQANEGNEVKISDVRKGDLLFFNTSGNSISHVGIIDNIENTGEIKFIHSSTSKGVIISSLDENYWKTRFVKAVRLL